MREIQAMDFDIDFMEIKLQQRCAPLLFHFIKSDDTTEKQIYTTYLFPCQRISKLSVIIVHR